MRTVAAAHALQQLPQPQQRQAAHRSTSLTPNSSSRSRTPQSRSSSSSSSMPSLQLPQPPAGLVAGSEVPAAEQAHSIGGPVGLPPHAAAQQAQAQVLCLPTGVAPDGTCDGLAAAASGLAADSWASRGGAAAGDDDEPSYYFPSSVSSGASAGDSEDPF
jgi:hypothetical protein